MKTFRFLMILLVAILIADHLYAQGCSQCRLLTEQGSELDEASFGSNINYGIIYLMLAPYLLLAILFRKKIFSLVRNLIRK